MRYAEPELAPSPGLASLDQLVEATRAAGLDLTLHVEGTPAERAPPGVDVAAFRIIQEGLTNALRHSNGTAGLTLRHRPDRIEVEIVNGRQQTVDNADGTGRGLVGMREESPCTTAASTQVPT